jgi:hypothetical protein
MKFILGMIGYLGIGFVWLLLATLIDRKLKLNPFWEYDPWGGWSRNYGEMCILFGWPVLAPIGVLSGLLYLLQRVCTLLIGKKPSDDKQENGPENKLQNDLLYNHLLSKGVNEQDAYAIAKELEEISRG